MKAAMLLMLLAGCVAPVPTEEPIETHSVPDRAQEMADEPKEREVRVKRTPRPPEKKEPVVEPKVLPPCESVPGDKKMAILQKLECVAETANKKPAPPKP